MFTHTIILGVSVALFAVMWLFYELGRWYGRRELRKDPDATHSGTGVIDAGVFGLLGLLLAFAFSGAAARLEMRRQRIVEEATTISTAWARLDLLPAAQQPELRELFRQYVDARIGAYEKIPDIPAVTAELHHADQLQGDIWTGAVKASALAPNPQIAMVVLPPINSMSDISVIRTNGTLTHTPSIIIVLLACSALLSAVLAAYGGADRPRRKLHVFVFNAIIAITIYVILDLDYPRIGLIRETASDRVMIELRASMK